MTHALQVLHTLRWHHPGGQALTQLAQAPAQDYNFYTHALLGVVEDEVTSPNGSPVRLQENRDLLSLFGLTGTPQRVPLLGLSGKQCTPPVHPSRPSPSTETCRGVPVRPQLLSSTVSSRLLHRRVIRTPHPHTRAHGMWVTDPNSTPRGRAVGGGGAPDHRRRSQRRKASPPPRGRPSANPTASNAGPQGRTLWGRGWVPTPPPTAPGTHGSRSPGCPLQRTGGRGRDSA